MNYIIAILLWVLFGLIHSLMARPFFKKLIRLSLGYKFEYNFYRFFYFISQCILLYFIYGLIKKLNNGKVIIEINKNIYDINYILYILSNLFLIISVLQFDTAEFTGIKQILNFLNKKIRFSSKKLNNKMFYKYIRHPMYLGIILVYIFSHTIFTTLFFINLACIIFYIEIGSYYEEKTLIKLYGKKYQNFMMKTPYKYLPYIR